MVIATLKKLSTGFVPITVMILLLLGSLYLMSAATQNSEQFGRLYIVLLLINILCIFTLVVLIGTNIIRLVRQYRAGVTGSRITVRLVVMFVILSLMPVSVLFYFSQVFIERGIDSWFDVRIEAALDDALELSRASLDARMNELLRQSAQMAEKIAATADEETALVMNDLRQSNDIFELTVFTSDGHVIASSGANPVNLVPSLPGQDILRQVRQGIHYVGIDPIQETDVYIRTVVTIPESGSVTRNLLLQALYPVSSRINKLAESVQSAYSHYKKMTLLRNPLKQSFVVTLSLVLLLGVLTAVWAAFFSARRLVAPIRTLAIGTRAVAAGDYEKRLPLHSNDELGFLVESFNEMTRKIAKASDEARRSQLQVEAERAYLRAVLGRLSSGVLTLDKQRILRTANIAARQILAVDFKGCVGNPLETIAVEQRHLKIFVDAIKPHLSRSEREWREEIVIFGASGRQVLMCGGATLPGDDGVREGHVIVFDDVTELVQAQRDAAWGEVARRLAHEIKNPLTPIQLSAERLRMKYLDTMNKEDAEFLDRSTHTIVQQVEVMKDLVQAFTEYAKTPQLELHSLDLNGIIGEVLDLYRGEDGIEIITRLNDDIPMIKADSGRLRQLLHNLIKNSIEAADESSACSVTVVTQCVTDSGKEYVEMRVLDNGPGIPKDIEGNVFEPYVTNKPKGSGLGLAVVKKIVEEHSGLIWTESTEMGGACIIVRFPVVSVIQGLPEEDTDRVMQVDEISTASPDDEKTGRQYRRKL